MKKRVKLTYPQDQIKQPVLFEMATKYQVMPNIRRAQVTETVGILVVELEGREEDMARAIEYLKQKGIVVENIEGDIVA